MMKVAAIAVSAALLVGCSHNAKAGSANGANGSGSSSSTSGMSNAQLQAVLNSLPNKVYFAFDKYDLNSDAINVLQQNAAVLLKNPSVTIMLAGNADPRGSVEYNFHLGMMRAKAVYNYLVQQGVPASQMCLVSYSDLKPAATPSDFGGNWQKAYALDRRTEINYNQTCDGWSATNYGGQ